MPHVLALDQGTTSSRAIVFDERGEIRAVAQAEFAQHFPRDGWVEHDAAEIWSSQIAVAIEALGRAELDAGDLSAIGITNQRETTVLWNRRTGEPIHHAIVWQDRRTADFCDELKASGALEAIRKKTGLVIDPYFSATKIRWLLDNVDGARDMAEAGDLAFGTIDSWLIWNLTNGSTHATDITNAARTMLLDIRSADWDDELLALFDIPRSLLPDVRPSSGVIDETARGHLGASVPIAGVAGDQQAALFGQLCTTPGMLKTTYGTGCFMLVNTGTKPRISHHQLLTTPAWRLGGRTTYAIEGSVFIGGAVIQWLRDGLGLIASSSDVEPLARSVDDNGGVYLVPAFAGLGAPYWDASARGVAIGLTRATTAGHVARAALEGIAYQVADVVEAMRDDLGGNLEQMRVDGGAAMNDLLMQFQADLLDLPLVRPAVTQTTALGAAYLAGLATDVWPEVDALADGWAADRTFEPGMSRDQAGQLRARWHKAVQRSKQWAGDDQA